MNKNSSAVKRLMLDFQEILQNPLPTISAHPLDANIFEWHVNIIGHESTAYKGGVFHLILTFPSNYPNRPPNVALKTSVCRSHVYGEWLCLDMLETHHTDLMYSGWSTAYSAQSILLQLQSYLFDEDESYMKNRYNDEDFRRCAVQANSYKCSSCPHDMAKSSPWPLNFLMAKNLQRLNKMNIPWYVYGKGNKQEINERKKEDKKLKLAPKKQEKIKIKAVNFSSLGNQFEEEEEEDNVRPSKYERYVSKIQQEKQQRAAKRALRNQQANINNKHSCNDLNQSASLSLPLSSSSSAATAAAAAWKINVIGIATVLGAGAGLVTLGPMGFILSGTTIGVASSMLLLYGGSGCLENKQQEEIKAEEKVVIVLKREEEGKTIRIQTVEEVPVAAVRNVQNVEKTVKSGEEEEEKKKKKKEQVSQKQEAKESIETMPVVEQVKADIVPQKSKEEANLSTLVQPAASVETNYVQVQQRKFDIFAKLTDDVIIHHILPFLYGTELLFISDVCKSWKNLSIKCSLHHQFESEGKTCFHTRVHYTKTILGIGLTLRTNPYSKEISYVNSPLDLLSYEAYYFENVRKSVWREKFTEWLPVFLDERHGSKAWEQFTKSINKIYNVTEFDPSRAILLLCQLMNTQVVNVMNGHIHCSIKALTGYSYFHRWLIKICERYPEVAKEEIHEKVLKFIQYGRYRDKHQVPIIGDFMSLLSVSTVNWSEFIPALIDEVFTRNVLWLLKEHPGLHYTCNKEQRIEAAFVSARTMLRLIMFHCEFLRSMARPNGQTLADVCYTYDSLCGQPPFVLQEKFQRQIFKIMKVSTFEQFFEFIQYKPDYKNLHDYLLNCQENSLVCGYHRLPPRSIKTVEGLEEFAKKQKKTKNLDTWSPWSKDASISVINNDVDWDRYYSQCEEEERKKEEEENASVLKIKPILKFKKYLEFAVQPARKMVEESADDAFTGKVIEDAYTGEDDFWDLKTAKQIKDKKLPPIVPAPAPLVPAAPTTAIRPVQLNRIIADERIVIFGPIAPASAPIPAPEPLTAPVDPNFPLLSQAMKNKKKSKK